MSSIAALVVSRLLEEKATTRYVGVVVLRKHNGQWQALIIQRTGPPKKGAWACPGGHVDEGEEDEAAAYRELEEETGVEATNMHLFEEEDVDIGHLAFFWTKVNGETRSRASDDAGKSKWVPVDDLPELAWENARQIRDACEEAGIEVDEEAED